MQSKIIQTDEREEISKNGIFIEKHPKEMVKVNVRRP